MDKYLCRKDVYDEIEKAMRDRSHLTEKVITDKNGHQRKVYVRGSEEPKKQRTKKVEEPTEKKTAKPKHSTGDTVTLDGAKGDFKVSSIDKDGTYHVVSADGKKGYKVSENHITGNKGQNKAQKMADAEDKAFEENQKNAQKKYGDMSIEELEKFIDEKSKAGKYTPEYKEAMDANDVLQQKKKEKKEIDFEKKNNASKSTVNPTVLAYRKQQQKKEKEKFDYNKRMNDFYVNTGLDGGPDAVLYRQAIEKEDNKQDNLKAGVRDDSIFNENDDVQFWRSGNYIDGKITQVKEDYRGAVSLQVEANGSKYWVETEDIIKHPASDTEKKNSEKSEENKPKLNSNGNKIPTVDEIGRDGAKLKAFIKEQLKDRTEIVQNKVMQVMSDITYAMMFGNLETQKNYEKAIEEVEKEYKKNKSWMMISLDEVKNYLGLNDKKE